MSSKFVVKTCQSGLRELSNSLNMLGVLYRYPPATFEYDAVARYFQTSDWVNEWSFLEAGDMAGFSETVQSLSLLGGLKPEEWKKYFGLEYSLEVPPWGSVYTDPEQAVNSRSTVSLELFLNREKIVVDTGEREPVDHVGTILMIMAYLAQKEETLLLEEFYTDHVSPWIWKYLTSFSNNRSGSLNSSGTELSRAVWGFIELTKTTLISGFVDKSTL